MGKPIFARIISPQEQDELEDLLSHSEEPFARRASLILLSTQERYRVSEIATLVGMHESSVRYWIHRFNKEGMSAVRPSEAIGQRFRVDPEIQGILIQIATTPPREMGLKFTTWTLRELRNYLTGQEIVEDISHETIRRILKQEDIDWQAAGTLPEDAGIPDLLGVFVSENIGYSEDE
jgi:transposase